MTLTDAYSRYLLACDRGADQPGGRGGVDRLFVNTVCQSDPTTTARRSRRGAGGLTRLSVQWLKLGIALERITPGRPQQNGRHERMHRTFKAETSRPPADSPGEQQLRFDASARTTITTPA